MFIKHHGMKMNGAPYILKLSTKLRLMFSYMPYPHNLQRRSLQYPLDKRLSGPQSRSECFGVEKISSSCWEAD
jgi:hypothetical protein